VTWSPSEVRVEAAPLAVAGMTIAGALLGQRIAGAATAPIAVIGAVALLLAWLTMSRARLVLAMAGVALLGVSASARALDGLAHGPLTPMAEQGASVVLRGRIASDPVAELGGVAQITLRASAVSADGSTWSSAGQRHVLLVAPRDRASALRVLEAGDRVTASGRLAPLTPSYARMRWAHVAVELHEARVLDFAPPAEPWFRLANAVRHRVDGGVRLMTPTDAALTLGFLVGDTRSISDAVVGDFRRAGLSHLLAVSGANVAFALALAGPALRRLRLGPRLVVGLAVLVLLALVTRWQPSVLRACVMAACAMTASFGGRALGGVRLLATAVTILVLADPFLVHQPGFQLSCAASLGIVVLARPVARRLAGPRIVRDVLAVSLAAQIGVAPVLLAVFGSVPLLAPLANLLAVPAAEPITVIGLPASVLATTGPVGVPARVALLAVAVLARWTRLVARAMAGGPVLHTRAAVVLGAAATVVLVSSRWSSSRSRACASDRPSTT
jgi:competence protein ComEC